MTTAVLDFDPVLHRYSVDGVVWPSVTQVLVATGIYNFEDIPRDQREYVMARGSAVHEATRMLDEDDLDDSTVSDTLRPYLDAYKKFKAESGFVPLHIESRVHNATYRYAGTLDRIGTFYGPGSPALLDIKCGPWQPGYAIQLAAYAKACDIKTSGRITLHLSAYGTYYLHHVATNLEQDFGTFLSALNVYQWRQAA